jgi:sulfate transport system ATP-binding protein
MSVVIEKLTKRLGGSVVVDTVSFEAPAGQVTSLLGPSGAGKSTVLRAVAGLEAPDSGTIAIDGADATHVSVQARRVGFVFQSFALFQHMTVHENVGFGLRVRGAKGRDIDARVRELLERTQLGELAARLPSELSGGQRQRVALARALAMQPRVLLLDEPFGALDAKVRGELRAWLRKLHDAQPVTTLMVTHDQDEALEMSDRVVVMNAGRVEQVGAPADIYDRPATPFVASFVGAANVLEGRVQGGRAALGTLVVAVPGTAAEGQAVRAFVRPHDVSLERPAASGGAAAAACLMAVSAERSAEAPEPREVASARVEKLVRIGWMVKLSLVLVDGQALVVQLTREQVEAMRIEEGDRVLVNLKEATVFVQDYVI